MTRGRGSRLASGAQQAASGKRRCADTRERVPLCPPPFLGTSHRPLHLHRADPQDEAAALGLVPLAKVLVIVVGDVAAQRVLLAAGAADDPLPIVAEHLLRGETVATTTFE